jgi:hypothetical protein
MAEIQEAVASEVLFIREGAVRELGRLLTGVDEGLNRAAELKLRELRDDDSRRISSMAAEILAELEGAEPSLVELGAELPTIAADDARPARADPADAMTTLLAGGDREAKRIIKECADGEHIYMCRGGQVRDEGKWNSRCDEQASALFLGFGPNLLPCRRLRSRKLPFCGYLASGPNRTAFKPIGEGQTGP